MIAVVKQKIVGQNTVLVLLLFHGDKDKSFRKPVTLVKKLFTETLVEYDRFRFGNGEYAENIVKGKLLVRGNNNADSASDGEIACAPFIAVSSRNGDLTAVKTEVKKRSSESLNISLKSCVADVVDLTDLIFDLEGRRVAVESFALLKQFSEIMKFSYFIQRFVHFITLQ